LIDPYSRAADRWFTDEDYPDGWDTKKTDLLEKLEKEVTSYGTNIPVFHRGVKINSDLTYVMVILDTLLLNYKQLKALDQAPAKDHDSLFKWLWAKKPLDDYELDWIWRPEDFVSMVLPRKNFFEDFIRSHLDNWPKSWLKVGSPSAWQDLQCH
jgi:hypothetical protein